VSVQVRCLGSRRRSALWRLFFFQIMLAWVALSAVAAETSRQQEPLPAQILERRLRLTRDAQGGYRVIESLLVRLETDAATPQLSVPLPLVRLQDGVDGVRGLGGDLAAAQVEHDPPQVTVRGPAPQKEFQVAFTYRLPVAATSLQLISEQEVSSLVVEVEKGSVDVRPDQRLARGDDGGATARPHRTYVASELAPGTRLSLELLSNRVDWRQRLAVLALTTLAAAAAGTYVWRGLGRRSLEPNV